jgi:Transposase DDE domain
MKPASFSQKLWRFSIDPRLEVSALIEPMHQLIRQEMTARPGVLLAIHDWSTLSFGGHASKKDRVELTHDKDVGYDLATVLMARGDDGAPIAPALVSLTTADGVLSTRDDVPAADLSHIDQVRVAMRFVNDLEFNPLLVHVIDREADSVDHWRQWNADGHLALVRADDRKVLCAGQATSLVAVADRLHEEDSFEDAGKARYRGRPARLYVAEAQVVLHRPGKRNVGRKKIEIPGPPLPLRLVVTEIRDSKGRVLARWLLLSNVPAALGDAATIARWYYFRWRIETYHKLLKGAGWQLESWLQQTGDRLLIKLMLALTACASIWALEQRCDAQAEDFKKLLMRLSGRQTKRNRAITTSGLLAGLWVLQCAVGPLARHGPDELNAMLENHLPAFASNNRC